METRRQHIHIEKIKLLYIHSLTPAILSGIASLFLVAALWSSANQQHLIIWLCTTIFLATLRISLILKFKHDRPQGREVLAWEAPYAISLIIVFLVWGVGLLLITPLNNLTTVFIVNTFMIGLAGSAISWYSAIRYLQLTTICIALLPMIGVLLALKHPETFWVGIAACCLFLSCMSTSVILQKTLNGNLELAYDLEQSFKNAEIVARTDVLTGLNNRRAFFDAAPALLEQCKRMELPASLIMFDLDFFKKINDEYGHVGGDIALRHVAELLRSKLRNSDVSCRFGGEEFTVLLPNTNKDEALITAEKLRLLIHSSPAKIDESTSITLSASFGVTDSGDTLDTLLNHADEAMYKAKNNGRNFVCVYLPKAESESNAGQETFKSSKSAKIRESLQV